jgi:hypothetical protein
MFPDSIPNFKAVIKTIKCSIHNTKRKLLCNITNLQIIMVQIQLIQLTHYCRTGNNIDTTGLVNLKAYTPPTVNHTADADFTIVLYCLCITFICDLRLVLFLNIFPHRWHGVRCVGKCWSTMCLFRLALRIILPQYRHTLWSLPLQLPEK